MTKTPDFSTVIYKILKYLDECQKKDIEPNFEIAKDLSKVNEGYFKSAVEEMNRKELIVYKAFYADNIPYVESMKITLDGAEYLRENSAMKKVAEFIDKTFIPELNLTIKLSLL